MSEVKFQCTKEILEKVKNGDSEATVLLYKNINYYPYLSIMIVILITHITSTLIIKLKEKNKKLII